MKSLTVLLIAAFCLSGCGYKLGEIRPTPMRSIRTLAVPSFKNQTYESRIEVLFADTLIKRLQQDGTYKIVSDELADAILVCTVVKIDRRSLRSVQNNVLATSEFGLRVEVNFEVQDRVTGALLLKNTVVGQTSFFSGNDLVSIERQALSIVAGNVAGKIAVQVAEGW